MMETTSLSCFPRFLDCRGCWTWSCPSCHQLEFPTISFKFQVFHWMTISLTMKFTISLSGNIQAFHLLDDMNITNVLVSFSRHINFISSSPNATFKHTLQQERNYGAPKVNFLKPIQNYSWLLDYWLWQGCLIILTIGDPRWDQPKSDIFISFCLWAANIDA